MKFVVEKLGTNGCRLGKLSGLRSCPDARHQTPMVLLTTQVASVPHITEDNLERLLTTSVQEESRLLSNSTSQLQPQQLPPLSVAAQHFAKKAGILKAFGKGVAAFAATPANGCTVFVHSPLVPTPSGYNCRSYVSVWSPNGRVPMKPDNYVELASSLQCDWCEALYDDDAQTADKSILAADKVYRRCRTSSVTNLMQCLKIAKDKTSIGGVMAPLIGGWDVGQRRKYKQELLDTFEGDREKMASSLAGLSIVGLHQNGAAAEDVLHDESVTDCVAASLDDLPSNLTRVALGGFNPLTTLSLVEAGVDVLDTTLPCFVTDRGAALTFTYSNRSNDSNTSRTNNGEPATKKQRTDHTAAVTGTTMIGGSVVATTSHCGPVDATADACSDATSQDVQSNAETNVKTEKNALEPNNTKRKQNSESNNEPSNNYVERPYDINLNNKKYAAVYEVLVPGCLCYTCSTGYTRSYLHHLARSKEMTFLLLLHMHNMHHWLGFFTSIRLAVASDSFEKLKNTVLASYRSDV